MSGLCIYHGGCTDGVAAAWAVHEARPDWEFYPGAYQKDPPWGAITRAQHVYLVDFSYKQPVIEKIVEVAGKDVPGGPGDVAVLDHHATAEDDLGPLLAAGAIGGEFDMERSGALMAWDWFNGGSRPELMRYIDARDRWIKDAPLDHNLDHVIMGLRSYPHTHPIDWNNWSCLMRDVGFLAREGKAIHRYYRQLVDAAKVRAESVALAGYEEVPCVNASFELASEVAGELAADSRHGWAFVWWRNSDGTYTTSLRSREGGPHVGNIATEFGGGGHPGAAGFRCSEQLWS